MSRFAFCAFLEAGNRLTIVRIKIINRVTRPINDILRNVAAKYCVHSQPCGRYHSSRADVWVNSVCSETRPSAFDLSACDDLFRVLHRLYNCEMFSMERYKCNSFKFMDVTDGIIVRIRKVISVHPYIFVGPYRLSYLVKLK